MNKKTILGRDGEDLATNYLVSQDYKIIERNFRKPWGEIDIIAKDPSGILVFVEVKTVAALPIGNDILPEDQATRAKIKKVSRTACLYANKFSDLVDDKRGWQIDLVAIEIFEKDFELRHYKNIVG